MKQLNSEFLKLPHEQLKWFLSFELLLKFSQIYDKKQFESLIEDIDRKAFKKGYLELILLLDLL